MKTLIVKVKAIEGKCNTHKVGDCFRLEGGQLSFPKENKHICIYALSSLLPLLPAKQRKIDEPDDWLPNAFRVECPDPEGRVVWEITFEDRDSLSKHGNLSSSICIESFSEDTRIW